VALEGEHRVVARHPLAVVRDAQEATAASLHVQLDAPRARVNRVLDQLLGDRGRALDDLARGNLVGDVI
jgi:hypothetical protein